MDEQTRASINKQVVEIVCNSLLGLSNNDHTARPDYKYLLNQAIRQYVPADTNKHISQAASYVWGKFELKGDIKNYYYDETLTPQAAKGEKIPTYLGANKTVPESFSIPDKFKFNKIFIVEHTTPVADIIDALRQLNKPINTKNVTEILEKIHTTTMLKIEDRRITKSSGRISGQDIINTDSNGIFNGVVSKYFNINSLIPIMPYKFSDPNLENLYNNGIQINP